MVFHEKMPSMQKAEIISRNIDPTENAMYVCVYVYVHIPDNYGLVNFLNAAMCAF